MLYIQVVVAPGRHAAALFQYKVEAMKQPQVQYFLNPARRLGEHGNLVQEQVLSLVAGPGLYKNLSLAPSSLHPTTSSDKVTHPWSIRPRD